MQTANVMIDSSTGEILTERTVYLRSDEIAVKLKPKEARKRGRRFVKLYNSREAKRSLRKLGAQECRFLLIASLYINHHAMIVGDGDTGCPGKPLTFDQLREVTGMSRVTLVKTIRSLKDAGLLEFDQGYRLHSSLVHNGVRV